MAGAAHQWRGLAVHGFDGPPSLAYCLDNAGHRHASNFEVCASLMNGALYANDNPPVDHGDHTEYEKVVVSENVFNGMEAAGQVQFNNGWRGYKPNPELFTRERTCSPLKVADGILLPVWEINGDAKFRRRIALPAQLLQPGEPVYYFLEYKSLPNMEVRRRASVLAQREAAAAAAAAAEVAAGEGAGALVDAGAGAAADEVAVGEVAGALVNDGAAAAAAEVAVGEVAGALVNDGAGAADAEVAVGEVAGALLDVGAGAAAAEVAVGEVAGALLDVGAGDAHVNDGDGAAAAATGALLLQILQDYHSSSDPDYHSSSDEVSTSDEEYVPNK